jgi:hypothetical protein
MPNQVLLVYDVIQFCLASVLLSLWFQSVTMSTYDDHRRTWSSCLEDGEREGEGGGEVRRERGGVR